MSKRTKPRIVKDCNTYYIVTYSKEDIKKFKLSKDEYNKNN